MAKREEQLRYRGRGVWLLVYCAGVAGVLVQALSRRGNKRCGTPRARRWDTLCGPIGPCWSACPTRAVGEQERSRRLRERVSIGFFGGF